MLRCAVLVVISLVCNSAFAQQTPPPAPPQEAAPPAQPDKPVVPMEEPRPGDHWTYEIRDEITGTITATRENVVTEVTPTEISVRFRRLGSPEEGLNVYDRSWNLVEAPPWRYSPNDGTGVRLPLAVGKAWPVQGNNVNNTSGATWKRSGTSKVVGQESIRTKAGTFDTFKIETTYVAKNVKDPTRDEEITSQTWYAPAVDHWVKRVFALRATKHLRTNNTLELVDYGRKQ
jgi:hypothetical protein